MRAGRVQFTRGEKGPRMFVSKVTAIILLIVGFLLIQPFFWNVFIAGTTYHYMTIKVLVMLFGFVIGLPMFIGGIVCLFTSKTNASASGYNDHDMSRVRYAVEEEMRRGNNVKR
jgi:predicted phage tail protein